MNDKKHLILDGYKIIFEHNFKYDEFENERDFINIKDEQIKEITGNCFNKILSL